MVIEYTSVCEAVRTERQWAQLEVVEILNIGRG